MNRPTCEICPFWDEKGNFQLCRRYAKNWAPTTPDDWCGEHPDFPEYVASLKRPRAPDAVVVEGPLIHTLTGEIPKGSTCRGCGMVVRPDGPNGESVRDRGLCLTCATKLKKLVDEQMPDVVACPKCKRLYNHETGGVAIWSIGTHGICARCRGVE